MSYCSFGVAAASVSMALDYFFHLLALVDEAANSHAHTLCLFHTLSVSFLSDVCNEVII